MKAEYYKPLDAIRGLLALAVVFFHAEWAGWLTSNEFARNGYLAVDVFFCLSGFLMFKLYGGLSSVTEARDFMAKRFARLYPLHLFTLFLMIGYAVLRLAAHKAGVPIFDPGEVIPFSEGSPDNLMTFLSNLFLTQSLGLHDELTFNSPAWSISVEFYTYIIFAGLMILAPIKKTKHIAILALGMVMIYATLAMMKPNLDITYDFGFFRCLAGFAAGIIACWMFTKSKPYAENLTTLGATLIEIPVLVIFITWFCYVNGITEFTIAPIMMALIIVFAHGKGLMSSFMNLKIFQYLGKISYSIYLNHALILIVINMAINKSLGGMDNVSPMMGEFISIIYILIVLAASHITYHIVEKPSAGFLNGLYRNRVKRRTKLRKRIETITRNKPRPSYAVG